MEDIDKRKYSVTDRKSKKAKKFSEEPKMESSVKFNVSSIHSPIYEEIRALPTGKYYNFRSPIVDKFDKNE